MTSDRDSRSGFSPEKCTSDGPDLREALRPLAPSELRARRRPVAIALFAGYQWATSLVVALPVYAFARAVWGHHPEGDRVLFRPGGLDLLTWLGGSVAAREIVGELVLALGVIVVLAHPIALGLLLSALATGRDTLGIAPRPRLVMRAAAPMFVPLAFLFFVTGAMQIGVGGLGLGIGNLLEGTFVGWIGERPAVFARALVFLPFAIVASVVGVEADLARARTAHTMLREPERPAWPSVRDAIVWALRIDRRAYVRSYLAWMSRTALAWVLIGLASVVTSLLGGRAGVALAVVVVVHRIAMASRAALRASWLAYALRTSSEAQGPGATRVTRAQGPGPDRQDVEIDR